MNLIPIIYENDEILVINKSAGMSVQGGEKIAHPLDEELSKQLGYKIYLVHRLDRDTCGLMIVAKTSAAANKWIKLISGKQVKKEYKAICIGKPVKNFGTITDSVEKAGVEKSAVTDYKLEKSFFVSDKTENDKSENSEHTEKIELSLLHLKLGTGRMHQIRIHLAKIGCPIAGDDKHGNFKLNKKLKKIAKVKNLLLCSCKLSLPLENSTKVFEIELPEQFQTILANV